MVGARSTWRPRYRISSAIASPIASSSARFQLDARASATGYTVVP